jgi:hypothetical protein
MTRYRRTLLALLVAVVAATLSAVAPSGPAQASSTSFQTRIINQGSGKCLDVTAEDDYYAAHARVQQYHCTGALEQSWTVWETNDDGCYPYCPHWTIQSRRSLMCMEVLNADPGNGAQVDQVPCTGVAWQLWRPISLDGGATQFLINVYTGKCLDLDNGSKADHARIQQWDCNWSTNNQKWRM